MKRSQVLEINKDILIYSSSFKFLFVNIYENE